MDRNLYALENFIGIMKECRRQLIEDAANGNPDLFRFLYEDKNSKLSELYEKRYELKWLESHFAKCKTLLDDVNASDATKRELLRIFLQWYQEFLKIWGYTSSDAFFFNAEIDALIEEKELERQSKIAETIANYQKTMAECSVSIGRTLGLMNIELREKATALVMEKQEQYKQLQDSATEKAMAQLENISVKFPEGSKANEMMTASVVKQLDNIIETSNKFMQTIDADFSKMMDSIGRITESTMLNANQYISPTFAKSITGSNDTKLIK